MIARVIVASLVVPLMISEAGAFCSKPSAPYCASGTGNFDDSYDFDRCKGEMDYYRTEVEDFLGCVKRESSEVVDEYNDTIASFYRRVRG
jgi:hypothetical protein